MPASIEYLDHFTQIALDAIWDTMIKESINSSILSEKTNLSAESIRAIIHGQRTVTMEELRSLCKNLKCDFDEFQVSLGMIPEAMKKSISRNRSMMHLMMLLNKACRDQNEADLTSYIESLLSAVNKD